MNPTIEIPKQPYGLTRQVNEPILESVKKKKNIIYNQYIYSTKLESK